VPAAVSWVVVPAAPVEVAGVIAIDVKVTGTPVLAGGVVPAAGELPSPPPHATNRLTSQQRTYACIDERNMGSLISRKTAAPGDALSSLDIQIIY